MKKYLTSLALVAFSAGSVVWGQQQWRRSQFITNTYLANPAVAGTEPGTVLSSSYRQQWAGFDGAPTTKLLSATKPFQAAAAWASCSTTTTWGRHQANGH